MTHSIDLSRRASDPGRPVGKQPRPRPHRCDLLEPKYLTGMSSSKFSEERKCHDYIRTCHCVKSNPYSISTPGIMDCSSTTGLSQFTYQPDSQPMVKREDLQVGAKQQAPSDYLALCRIKQAPATSQIGRLLQRYSVCMGNTTNGSTSSTSANFGSSYAIPCQKAINYDHHFCAEQQEFPSSPPAWVLTPTTTPSPASGSPIGTPRQTDTLIAGMPSLLSLERLGSPENSFCSRVEFMSTDTPLDAMGTRILAESPPQEAIRCTWPSQYAISSKSGTNTNVSVTDDLLSERALAERGEIAYAIPPNPYEWVPLFEKAATPRKSIEDDRQDAEEECSSSRSPSPWLEAWYENDEDMDFDEFAANMIAEFPIQDGSSREFRVAGADPSDTGGQKPVNSEPISAFGLAQGDFGKSHGQAKRLRDDPGAGGEDDGPPGPKRQMVMRPPDGNVRPKLMYACPYQKRYPVESPLCGIPHGAKREYGWESVSRVKQHLLESHGRDHHCQNCWKAFKKVESAEKCVSERDCDRRDIPPKMWLTDVQITLLRAQRIGQGDDGWYRIFGLLFQDIQENGAAGFRSKYTPYYCEADKTYKSNLLTPTSGVTPNSMWTPSSDSTSFTPKCPDSRLISQTTDEDSFTDMFPNLVDTSTLPDASANSDTFTTDHGFPVTPFPNTPLWTSDNPGFHTAMPSDMTGSLFGTGSGPPPLCSCMGSKVCGPCRLKERNSVLCSENKDLRSENKKLRTVIDLIKSAVDEHYEVLSDVEEQGLLPLDTMDKLWNHQKQLGTHLKF